MGKKQVEISQIEEKRINSKVPWIFVILSLIFMVAYIAISIVQESFSVGTFICMFVIVIPIQTFLHIYFTYAIHHDSFSTIAGFDSNVEYNDSELKNLLILLDIHIGVLSTTFTFLFGILNCFARELGWMNGVLILLFVVNFMICILIDNYKYSYKIYIHERDKKMFLKSIPVTMSFILLLVAGMAITFYIFESKGIENNTAPAMKLAGLLLLGEGIATVSYLIESNKIQKWDIHKTDYKISWFFKICMVVSILILGVMFAV